jgi:hypothetical protein
VVLENERPMSYVFSPDFDSHHKAHDGVMRSERFGISFDSSSVTQNVVRKVERFVTLTKKKNNFLTRILAYLQFIVLFRGNNLRMAIIYPAINGYTFEIDEPNKVLWCNPPT